MSEVCAFDAPHSKRREGSKAWILEPDFDVKLLAPFLASGGGQDTTEAGASSVVLLPGGPILCFTLEPSLLLVSTHCRGCDSVA